MALGCPHPDILLEQLTASQLAELEGYDEVEMIGGLRDDYRMAQVCHLMFTMAQAIYGKKGRRRKGKLEDFMLWGTGFKRPAAGEPTQTVEEQKQILLGIANWAKKGR